MRVWGLGFRVWGIRAGKFEGFKFGGSLVGDAQHFWVDMCVNYVNGFEFFSTQF